MNRLQIIKKAKLNTKDSKEPKKELSHTLRNAIAGGAAGAIATAATLPLETLQIKESLDKTEKGLIEIEKILNDPYYKYKIK
jgi:hypothetical protein